MNFEGMKKRFYELMDIDPVKGIPSDKRLVELGMDAEAKRVRQED
jgi:aldehyde:ferredoxin oxidoreductase